MMCKRACVVEESIYMVVSRSKARGMTLSDSNAWSSELQYIFCDFTSQTSHT